jgi:hypothetical protein
MKKYFFLMLFLWVSILSQAQSPLKIQVTMLPPYPTTISDLQTRSNQVVILVQNLSRQSYTFVLGGELTDDNGVSLKAVPFVGQTTLTVNALKASAYQLMTLVVFLILIKFRFLG